MYKYTGRTRAWHGASQHAWGWWTATALHLFISRPLDAVLRVDLLLCPGRDS